ncbi:ATP-binding protein [Streptomyces scopuliridis]|uniref:ATP-binding protein n=1 Tax=Streptomyces scopuliridis TaxID=452529 RepID=UPI002DDA5583|nr:ATP-binding protein [Streptomyces scopuliridis]WSB35128.1 ATP-binding protein [Streptomyces scopuliridis]
MASTRGRSGPEPVHQRPGDHTAATLITDLPFGPRAAEIAREAVSVALRGDIEADLVDDARLIGSELATNAFTSGSPPLVLCIDRIKRIEERFEVEITVTDGGCPLPAASTTPGPPDQAESGRGLVIVKALADAWSLTTSTQGSRAWCRLTRSARSDRGATR